MDDSAIICDEVVESYNEEMRSIPTSFNGKNVICKTEFLHFTYLFINYHYVIDSCYYILLFDKISKKIYLLPFHDTKLKQYYNDNINLKWVITLKNINIQNHTYYFLMILSI